GGGSRGGSSSATSSSSLGWPPNYHLRFLERVRLIDGFESIRRLPEIEEEVQRQVLSGDSNQLGSNLLSPPTHPGLLTHSGEARQQGGTKSSVT
ncbi:hypothetical protein CSUI_011108, partial [Cystoisospora suis]